MEGSRERLGEPLDCHADLTPSAGEKVEKLGGSILDYSKVLRKIWQGWWGILEPKSPVRGVLPFLGQDLSWYL